MAQNESNYNEQPHAKIARIPLYFGTGSLLLLPAAITAGFLFKSIGILTIFRVLVMPISLAATPTINQVNKPDALASGPILRCP